MKNHPFRFQPACCLALWAFLFSGSPARADGPAFTNLLHQAALAEKSTNVAAAAKIYRAAERLALTSSPALCVLCRKYCDLMYYTNSPVVKKELLDQALACSLQALKADSNNANAHACLAVCYAKRCDGADIKSRLNYSRLFKLEAEQALALDPKQDVAYYLLGRWNYGVANVGLLSRALVKVVYGGLPQASNADAIVNFKKAIELAPNRIIHHAGLAMVYSATGEKPQELAELKICRRLKPTGFEDEEAQRAAREKLQALGQ